MCILRSDLLCRRSRTAVVYFLGTVVLSGSLSLVVLSLSCLTISLDVFGLLAVVAYVFIAGLAATREVLGPREELWLRWCRSPVS